MPGKPSESRGMGSAVRVFSLFNSGRICPSLRRRFEGRNYWPETAGLRAELQRS